MREPEKKDRKHEENRENRTGEDIDMLRERDDEDGRSRGRSSDAYKDDYDAA